MGVVIGETAEIGDDCNILQGVTLGGTSLHRTKRHPTLGDRVTVGAGAKLIGAVEIGDNARIGAGSVVVTNVPANATVVGVPGHVVSYHDPGSDTITKLPDPEWDRIDALERHIERLDRRIRALQEQPRGPRWPHVAKRARTASEPVHLHRRRDDAQDNASRHPPRPASRTRRRSAVDPVHQHAHAPARSRSSRRATSVYDVRLRHHAVRRVAHRPRHELHRLRRGQALPHVARLIRSSTSRTSPTSTTASSSARTA